MNEEERTKVFMLSRIRDDYVVGYASSLVEIAHLNEFFPSSEYKWTECAIVSHNRLIEITNGR